MRIAQEMCAKESCTLPELLEKFSIRFGKIGNYQYSNCSSTAAPNICREKSRIKRERGEKRARFNDFVYGYRVRPQTDEWRGKRFSFARSIEENLSLAKSLVKEIVRRGGGDTRSSSPAARLRRGGGGRQRPLRRRTQTAGGGQDRRDLHAGRFPRQIHARTRMNERYSERMRAQLGDEFAAYAACLGGAPARGIRVNTLKLSPQEFCAAAPFPLEPVPWEPSGFYIEEEKPGKSPLHDAGLFMCREPSAMCAAPLLAAAPGERVLDLCSAPGGKGTQLAQAMRGQGNPRPQRKDARPRPPSCCKTSSGWASRTPSSPAPTPPPLADRFEGYFDKILVDAPCSGEGMLRKEGWPPPPSGASRTC